MTSESGEILVSSRKQQFNFLSGLKFIILSLALIFPLYSETGLISRLDSALSAPQAVWQRIATSALPEPHSGAAFTLNTTNQIALFYGGNVLETGPTSI